MCIRCIHVMKSYAICTITHLIYWPTELKSIFHLSLLFHKKEVTCKRDHVLSRFHFWMLLTWTRVQMSGQSLFHPINKQLRVLCHVTSLVAHLVEDIIRSVRHNMIWPQLFIVQRLRIATFYHELHPFSRVCIRALVVGGPLVVFIVLLIGFQVDFPEQVIDQHRPP